MSAARFIPITEAETAALIRAATEEPLALTFGSQVRLDTDKSPKAARLLVRMRFDTLEDGSGI